MKSSELQLYLAKQAAISPRTEESRSITPTTWVISLITLVQRHRKNELDEEELGEDALKELTEVKALLMSYVSDLSEAKSKLENAMEEESYSEKNDAAAYSLVEIEATMQATQRSEKRLDAMLMLTLMLKKPTPLLKSILSDSSTANTSARQSSTSMPVLNQPGEDTSEQTERSAQPDSQEQNLADIVQRAREIQKVLLENVFGQDLAVNTFVSGFFQAEMLALTNRENTKPKATFLFAGPPGVGKTFLAEKAAEVLGLPFMRFDMSEYADKEANIEFCGSDKVYKNGKAGNVTGFVAEHPKCVLLFDEIEKAHINVIHLFLQILDAGRIRDNFTDEEVSFSQVYIIFTTNAGRNLYDDPNVANLSAMPRKKILKALSTDINPMTQLPQFPAAICSRFAAGNVVMFNHLGASDLLTIAGRHLKKHAAGFESSTGIRITLGEKVPTAIMLSEGGKADARTVSGRATTFFYEELYELFRLLSSDGHSMEQLKEICVGVALEQADAEVRRMFVAEGKPEVLLFAERDKFESCIQGLTNITCYVTDSVEQAKELLFDHDISVVLCDVYCGSETTDQKLLNAEDIKSRGHDFLSYILSRYALPVYLIQREENEISTEEFLSFAKMGVRDILTVNSESEVSFDAQIEEKCRIAHQQSVLLKLARENKILTYQTSQERSNDHSVAHIHLFDFRLGLATDVEDSKSVLENISKPNVHFDDVIGAEDAKRELTFFVEYLKDPVRYMRKGVRAPKGVLLYGPPGTGKTLLAKAMAGESDVTFLRAEGNQFLKRYVGEGPEALHALFNAARKYAPSILFIDEIDSIGKTREAFGTGEGSSDVLTALLTEMDGFNTDTTKPVFVLAATNFEVEPGSDRSLDAALLRRFDRRIYVDLPNKDERRRFLEMALAKHLIICLSDEQIENIAVRSTGMSLAELESVIEMALRNAIRTNDCTVDDAAFEDAFETFHDGEKKEWHSDTLTRTARHEAGHALLCWLAGETPSYLTVIARGNHGGYMQHGDREGKMLYTKQELLDRIRTSLGGRAAELVYYGEQEGVSTGASGDLRTATSLAEQMLCHYGMDTSIGMSYLDNVTATSPLYAQIRARTNEVLADVLAEAVMLIDSNRVAMDRMVEVLLEKNHLKADEIDAIFASHARR